MCGFAGIARSAPRGVDRDCLARMGGAIRHRGPDGFGYVRTPWLGAVHVRLSVLDPASGAQPMRNEDGRVLALLNGEIFNFVELREELRRRGHVFRTRSDTEVLVHGWEEWGDAMLGRLNGEYAFLIHDRHSRTTFLARDRFGIRPLFLAERSGDLHFASEIKALFAGGEISAEPSPEGLDEVFTFWGARPPRTPFRGISQLPPGSCAVWREGRLRTRRYWTPDFREEPAEPADALDRLNALLMDGISLRMRADVTVGGYLSGGLDSGITCALAGRYSGRPLRTFSVAFEDPRLDESGHQELVASHLATVHHRRVVSAREIADVFPEVVRHAETPLVRTAPAPLLLLSRLTREQGIKVVLTGEGADELFLGYDLFKETRIRRFCLRRPSSHRRAQLFRRIHPELGDRNRRGEFWPRFFLEAGSPDDPLFSHLPRFTVTSWIKEFYSRDMRAGLHDWDAMETLRATLPPRFREWSPLNRAAYLELETLLSPYLLAAQGDRVAMASGVEGRVPFLDHRLFEFAASLPVSSKLRVLREKDILRRWAGWVLPAAVGERPKQAYRAPDASSFVGSPSNNGSSASGAGPMPDWVRELLDPGTIRDTGYFEPAAVTGLLDRALRGKTRGFRENQAFVAILSTQLWHDAFLRRPPEAPPLPLEEADEVIEEEPIPVG